MKSLGNIKSFPTAKAVWEEKEARKNTLLERATWLEDQKKALLEEVESEAENYWVSIRTALKEDGLETPSSDEAVLSVLNDGEITVRTPQEHMALKLVEKIPKELLNLLM